MTLQRRLAKLEAQQAQQPAVTVGQVVIYDPATGRPITEYNPRAAAHVWLPDNHREAEGMRL